MDIKQNGLCEEGTDLWVDMIRKYSYEKHTVYLDHVKSCKECKRTLDTITELLQSME